jgi:hypothetical protein
MQPSTTCVRFPKGAKIFLFATIQWVLELSREVKRQGREADHSLPCVVVTAATTRVHPKVSGLSRLLTYSMVQDIIWKADCHSACQKISCSLMEPEGSLPCSHKPASWIQFAPLIPTSLRLLRSCQRISPGPRRFETFRNDKKFLRWGLLAPCPTPKLDHPLLAVRDCLFNIFAATLRTRRTSLHPQPEDAPCRSDKGPT